MSNIQNHKKNAKGMNPSNCGSTLSNEQQQKRDNNTSVN